MRIFYFLLLHQVLKIFTAQKSKDKRKKKNPYRVIKYLHSLLRSKNKNLKYNVDYTLQQKSLCRSNVIIPHYNRIRM